MNKLISMNSLGLSIAALQEAIAAKLEELLRGVGWLRGWQVQMASAGSDAGFDLLASVPLPGGGSAALCVVCKRELRPSLFFAVARRSFQPPGQPTVCIPVLASPWVSPRMAELCLEAGWSWFDLAGNHRIEVPGLLRLQHSGSPAVHARPRPAVNLGTPEAGRVIRTLLLPAHAGRRWTQREVMCLCRPNVSLGLVNKVVRYLRDEAFLEVGADGGFRLRDPRKLLFVWRDAYRFDRHERRGYFTLLQGNRQRQALAELGARSGGFAAYAAFSAAELQAPHVRQPKTWLYVRSRELSLFEALVEAKRVDSGENLVVLLPDDEGVFQPDDDGTPDVGRLPATNAIQTYVDLCHCGGRGEEAAEALLNQRLNPEWKRRGLNT